ncbi:SCO7613 C-terminal domain-containing membrane protein [Microbacterium ulmi]|uniref:Uncharacterized protein n=1 Tax=Microbacterium ulmi TaxID=179095 RepID=A0A7Y2LYM7_9MICO|nr:hypothetical protein [Microbacterium ulmi]NII69772.1 hypothetical protein [Microbacterium ulmi]NNH03256.1 hypothetical protein [Microbacterium ulmi]
MSASSVPATRRVPTWSSAAAGRLLDTITCPVCEDTPITHQRCPNCGADFTGGIGAELWDASQAAVAALEARQSVLDRVPVRPVEDATAPAVSRPAAASVLPSAPQRASATVQSVLAVAGAGLVAIAAIVFTFFNPDLTDRGARGLIIAAITLAFLFTARSLARRGLQFSAEAVGALGMVFLALDVQAFSQLAPDRPWTLAALGTLIAGAIMAALAVRLRIRVWLWTSLLGLALVPAMFAFDADGAGVFGWLGTAVAASVLVEAVGGLARRFGDPLRSERVALTIVQVVATVAAFGQQWLAGADSESARWLGMSALLAAIAALSLFSTRHVARSLWSFVAGGAGVLAFVALPLSAEAGAIPFYWQFALLPAAAVVGLNVVAALVPLPRTAGRSLVTGGAVTAVALSAFAPTAVAGLTVLLAVLLRRDGTAGATDAGGTTAVILGLSALAAGLVLFSLLRARRDAAAPTRGAVGRAGPAAVPDGPVALSDGSVALSDGSAAMQDGPDSLSGDSVALSIGSAAVSSGPAAVQIGHAPLDADEDARADASARGASVLPPIGTRWLGDLGVWYAVLAGLTLASAPGVLLWGRIAIGLGLAIAVGAALVLTPLRTARAGARVPLIVGAHLAILLCAITSWRDDAVVVGAGIAVVVTIAAIARTVPASVRFVHAGAGYAYALVVLATALTLWGTDPIPVVCLTTSAGALTAVAGTFLASVPPRTWYALLVVTAVPFALGVVQVLFERSGWTALSTGLIFLLALTLVVTRRPGLGIPVRSLAAATLVPSLAVVVVCLGAQLLAASGSPVVLPVIAVIVALTLPSTAMIRSALASRIGEQDASLVRLAIEASTLLTAAIAVLLAIVRDAAGLGTTFLVLVVLGIGAAATSVWAKRRYGWWLAGASFTGALWCVWGMTGVGGVEPFLLPPALGAAAVGAALTARGKRGAPLYASGLAVAIVPLVAVLAIDGTVARGYGLVAASWVLVALGLSLGLGRWRHAWRLRALRPATFAAAIAAAAAAAVLGVRFGAGLDSAPDPLVVVCLATGIAGAVPAALAARGLLSGARPESRLSRTRWLHAPAALCVAVAAWPAIHRDWFTIWTMWALMLAYLLGVVAIAWRSRARTTSLPPVWFVFAIAFVTAVVAWSPRDLRVEWFSLPLGLLLLAAGALHLSTRDAAPRRSPNDWPAGFAGSWALLAPGIVVTLGASIAATFTDPLTWRAILVIVLALIAILVGAGRRLAAPFFIGVVVLPVENALAFLVQIGRGIQSMPWWITLAVVGAVLLIIAVTYERRAGEDAGIAARLRDLA